MRRSSLYTREPCLCSARILFMLSSPSGCEEKSLRVCGRIWGRQLAALCASGFKEKSGYGHFDRKTSIAARAPSVSHALDSSRFAKQIFGEEPCLCSAHILFVLSSPSGCEEKSPRVCGRIWGRQLAAKSPPLKSGCTLKDSFQKIRYISKEVCRILRLWLQMQCLSGKLTSHR